MMCLFRPLQLKFIFVVSSVCQLYSVAYKITTVLHLFLSILVFSSFGSIHQLNDYPNSDFVFNKTRLSIQIACYTIAQSEIGSDEDDIIFDVLCVIK